MDKDGSLHLIYFTYQYIPRAIGNAAEPLLYGYCISIFFAGSNEEI